MFTIFMGQKITERTAVRGVYYNKNKELLLVNTNKGDYGLPGGGIQSGESIEQALRRELLEETGYYMTTVLDQLGCLEEARPDIFEEKAIFYFKILVYQCEIEEANKKARQLEEYEAQLEMHPVFIDLEAAYRANLELLKEDPATQNPWLQRETAILNKLRNNNK